MLALQGLTPDALVHAVRSASGAELELPQARRIVSNFIRGIDLDKGVAGIRRTSWNEVRKVCHVPELEIASEKRSAVDPFVKYALRTAQGDVIETVRIPLERTGRFSVCVSSQVGCALACAFCATGRLGLRRNLETWEIVEQIRIVRRGLQPGERVHGVLFQGMGEPLANFERVVEAIRVLNEPSGLAIDARTMTVCTAGLPSGIRRLAREVPRVRLGWSIGSAIADRRRSLMPITNAHSIEDVFDAIVEHATITQLAPMWAITLLAGVNDSDDDARALARLAHKLAEKTSVRPRISIIPYNAIAEDEDPFARASKDRERRFRDVLAEGGFGSHWRYSGGGDISAACGQLAGGVSERG